MTKWQAFLVQAKSDLRVFELLMNQPRGRVPACHPLHYLQMATEKLAKASFLKLGVADVDTYTHVAFSTVRHHLRRRDIGRALGWKKFDSYRRFLSITAPIHRELDELNPAVGPQAPGGGPKDGPNVEYPWLGPGGGPELEWRAPAAHDFPLLERLRRGEGAQVLGFVRNLLNRFDAVFP